MKRALVAVLALAACAHADVSRTPAPPAADAVALSGYGPRAQDWASIRMSVRAAPLSTDAPTLTSVGPLVFRGGLELASDDARFGGLSGLYVDDEDRLLAVSDEGYWFAARLVLDDAGALTGLADPSLALMRGDDGQPLDSKRQHDAEDIARVPDGRFAVSFEQIHLVRLYDLAKRGPMAGPDLTLRLAGTEQLESNDSLEALAAFGDKLLIGAEGMHTRPAPFWIAALSGAPAAPAGNTQTQDGFGLVSLGRLPDGDFIAMERFFAPLIGPRIYLRRVTQAGLDASPARWEGPKIAELAPPVALDNFEGLAVTRARDGAVRIYIVSDNNFSKKQRTLLYAFDLKPPAAPSMAR